MISFAISACQLLETFLQKARNPTQFNLGFQMLEASLTLTLVDILCLICLASQQNPWCK